MATPLPLPRSTSSACFPSATVFGVGLVTVPALLALRRSSSPRCSRRRGDTAVSSGDLLCETGLFCSHGTESCFTFVLLEPRGRLPSGPTLSIFRVSPLCKAKRACQQNPKLAPVANKFIEATKVTTSYGEERHQFKYILSYFSFQL